MSLPSKIAINGRGGSGKDVLADYLVTKYGYKKIAFADPIYEIARKYFGMTTKDRELLQYIGQKFREIRSTIWVDYAMKLSGCFDKVVISDLRQANEYSICLKNYFVPFRISADLEKRIDRIKKRDSIEPKLELLENESETGADDYKYIEIDNNGSFEDLYNSIDKIYNDRFDWNNYMKQLQYDYKMRQYY